MNRHIRLKNVLTTNIIDRYFDINNIAPNVVDLYVKIDNINFHTITCDIYLYIIEKCRVTVNYFKNILEEFYKKIKNADNTITFLTTKIELCDVRINTLSSITLYLDIIINTSFKIKHLIQKILHTYSYTKLQYYYYNFALVIDKCSKWNKTIQKLLNESYDYLNLSYKDAEELCELFDIDKSKFISNVDDTNAYENINKPYTFVYNIIYDSVPGTDTPHTQDIVINNTQDSIDTIDTIDQEFISSLDDIDVDINMVL